MVVWYSAMEQKVSTLERCFLGRQRCSSERKQLCHRLDLPKLVHGPTYTRIMYL